MIETFSALEADECNSLFLSSKVLCSLYTSSSIPFAFASASYNFFPKYKQRFKLYSSQIEKSYQPKDPHRKLH